jgi:diadenylate cyclase
MLETIRSFFEFNFPFQGISLPPVNLSALIDVTVISFVIYRILMLIKQTRAWIIFKGVILLFIVYGAAFLFNLETVLWIMGNALSAGLITLVVLFQPELRKVFEKLGKDSHVGILSGDVRDKMNDRTVEAVVTASAMMAKVRTGALIVIERDVPLGDFTEHGIFMDSVVSSQLLINIFEKNTPLHDGAVIIRNNRVTAATCLLPLTKNELSSDLGTRHRAAIGASEVSDAFVIVVSEETGHISIANEGRLYRNVSADEMYEMMTVQKRPTRKVKSAARRKVGAK